MKYKLTLMLVSLTGLMLMAFSSMALRDFEQDKTTYVLDSSFAFAQSTARLIRAELKGHIDRIEFLTRGYDGAQGKFHPYTPRVFPGENQMDALMSFHKSPASNQYVVRDQLLQKSVTPEQAQLYEALVLGSLDAALRSRITLRDFKSDGRWALLVRVDSPGAEPIVVAAVINRSDFLKIFENSNMLDTFLVASDLKVLAKPYTPAYELGEPLVNAALATGQKQLRSADGIFQHQDPSQGEILVAVSDTGVGGMKVVSFVPKAAALEAARLLLTKSLVFLGFLLCLTVFLSIVSSAGITASLKKLLNATKEIAKGNFAVSVRKESSDEVGQLAEGFNSMASEIQRLVDETAEKARMEGELKTAQLVQSTLFPPNHFQDEHLEIKGFYQPASECSGDWWYYTHIGNKTLFCIGDATGHGVPAALITAAARSAASTIESYPEIPLNEVMAIFNRSIYNTARGQVMMTMFLGLYDRDLGKIFYCNASHEPPYLIPKKEKVKKSDLLPLMEASGTRLGENLDATYTMAEADIQPGDRLLLYTDGITELMNKDKEMWGERALIKCLLKSTNEGLDLTAAMKQLADETSLFRKDYPLQDDITYFMLSRAS